MLLDIPGRFPRIIGDSDRLRQVITNLTTNAIKYSPEGGSINVRCRERGANHVVIEVIDHGLGHPPGPDRQAVREVPARAHAEHMKISGTGLGLYICRLIVEGHGGQIWVESELGRGSTFGIVLPLDASAANQDRRSLDAESQPERHKESASPRTA